VAARLLARRAYAAAELAQRLEAMGYAGETAARTVRRCVEVGWVNDEELARSRAAALRARGAGSQKIAADLEGRGVPRLAIDAALAASRGDRSEAAWARAALEAAGIDPATAPARAWRLLAGRGFPEPVVVDVVGEPE
jgi:regulatory protein